MRLKTILIFLALCLMQTVSAQNWDHIVSSGEYYYGVGIGKDAAEAKQSALTELTMQISVNVSTSFAEIDDMTDKDGEISHETRVLNCVRTYSQSTLTNAEFWPPTGKEPEVTVRCHIKRSDLARIFESRIAKAKDMTKIAADCLETGKVDMALQYYYWAYSLVRSLQYPNEVTDEHGILVDWIPVKINEILSDVSVSFDSKDGDYVDLLFTYKGQPVSSIEFTYSDGRTECNGLVRDGRGMLEMVPGYETDIYHVNIEYECREQARGDMEMENVLGVITPKPFPKAQLIVDVGKGKQGKSAKGNSAVASQQENRMTAGSKAADNRKEDASAVSMGGNVAATSVSTDVEAQARVIADVIAAIEKRDAFAAKKHFTIDGQGIYNQLIARGNARVVNKQNITFSKRTDGTTIVRGLQMSFTFAKRKKQTVVDEVVFTLNKENLVANIAFGLGKVAEDDILLKNTAGWKAEVRELLVEFMENYKTAYNLKRIDYIRDIFADDAVIIVGNVAKRKAQANVYTERPISVAGQDVINYNRYTKDQYLKNLERCMNRNEFINIRFTNNDIQRLDKYKNEEIFAIQIGQEYNSSTYADMGYLFLLVDLTNREEPQIKIRTWQPNEVDMEKIYHAGYFYDE